MNKERMMWAGVFFALLAVVVFSCEHEPFEPKIKTPPTDTTDTVILPTDTTDTAACFTDTIYFDRDIWPIISTNCAITGCHAADTKEDGVDLSSYDNIMATADVNPFKPEDSDFYEVLVEDDGSKRMPYGKNPLNACDIKAIKRWIEQGALNLLATDTTDTTPAPFVPSFKTTVQPMIKTYCSISGCHISSAAGKPALNTYTQIFGQRYNIIDAINSDDMPKPGYDKPLQAEIDSLEWWIDGDAPNN